MIKKHRSEPLNYFNEVRVLNKSFTFRIVLLVLGLSLAIITATDSFLQAGDLGDVIKAGKLRHLGIPYANFVIDKETGLDVELMKLFAAHLGVKYEFVETNWQNVVTDLTGKVVKPQEDDITIVGEGKVRGDVIAAGFTVLPWRKKIVDFSTPTFPSGIWLIARADSVLQPVKPTGNITQDIASVKATLKGKRVLGLADSCLDPALYGLKETGADITLFSADRNLDEMIPSVIARMADTTLMDVPVALVALEKWPGEIKVLGPVSPVQDMACAFPKTSPKLRRAFDEFFKQRKADGTYKALVRKYYPSVFSYYGKFFEK